jgi:diaminohydroxyphosphoribosylaminopyrimidine deaminase/5-amino-6-(5-phosphoribosylamino)uracil reductase
MTSPSVTTKPLPGCPSPTTNSKGPVQYRIEERSRTVYVSSDVHPSQWEHRLDQIFSLAEESGAMSQTDAPFTGSISTEGQVLVTEESANMGVPEGRTQSRSTSYRSRRSEFMPGLTSGTHTDSPRRSSPRTMVPPRILFYHKHDPHYGFTNFSEHPVTYKGKRYPTSEHLFQSFKVGISCGYPNSYAYSYFSIIVPGSSPESSRTHSNLLRATKRCFLRSSSFST